MVCVGPRFLLSLLISMLIWRTSKAMKNGNRDRQTYLVEEARDLFYWAHDENRKVPYLVEDDESIEVLHQGIQIS